MDESAIDNVDSKMLEGKELEMADLMQLIAKSHGISQLSNDSYNEISDSVTFVLKLIINQSLKFMDKNNHLRLTVEDIGFGMKSLGVEPVFSFICKDLTLFRHGRGGNGGFPISDQEMELVVRVLLNCFFCIIFKLFMICIFVPGNSQCSSTKNSQTMLN